MTADLTIRIVGGSPAEQAALSPGAGSAAGGGGLGRGQSAAQTAALIASLRQSTFDIEGEVESVLERAQAGLPQPPGGVQAPPIGGGRRPPVAGAQPPRVPQRDSAGRIIPQGGARAGAAGAGGAAAGGVRGALQAAGLAALFNPVTLTVAGFAAALTAGVLAVKKANKAFDALAADLEQFSPQISATRARGESARTLQQLDRARRIGPGVANLEAARLRLSEKSFEVQTKMLELMLTLSPVIELGVDSATVLVGGIDTVLAAIARLQATFTINQQDDKDTAARLKQSLEELHDAIRELGTFGQGGNGLDPMFEAILGADFQRMARGPFPQPGLGGGP